MKIGQAGSFHSIPARIVTVTSIRDSSKRPYGWKAFCYGCNSQQNFPLNQHTEACAFRLTHECFKGKKKITVIPAHQSNLHSGKTGTLGR